MVKAYQVVVHWHTGEQDFSQWFVEMDAKQLAAMRAQLDSGLEGHAYASYSIKPHKLGTYSKTLSAIAEIIKNYSY
jgi:hypothetical protein